VPTAAPQTGLYAFTTALRRTEVEKVLATIAATIIAYLIKLGILSTEGEWLEVPASGMLHEDHPLYARMLHASSLGYTTEGTQNFHQVRKLGKGYGYLGEPAAFKGPFCARQNGFTIHCARRIKSEARGELEQLIRYATRPPLSEKRLALLPSGEVEITLKNPYADGTRALVLTPLGLLSKLASIIPPAWAHLTRYGGILAPAAKDRAAVVPSPKEAETDTEQLVKGGNYHWAAMLKRIFTVDLTICPRCASLLKSIAAITDPTSIAEILRHFSQGPDPPLSKAA
jgi:Putative transposase